MAVSTLITDYLGKGLAASRPASPVVATGALALYFATDTGMLSKWDGAAWSDTPQLSGINVWTAAQRYAVVSLTDAATIATDLDLAINFTVTLGGNRTLGNPTHSVAGQAGRIVVKQDGTGSRTLAYASNWKFAAASAPVLTTAASAIDILSYYVVDSTHIAVSAQLNVS